MTGRGQSEERKADKGRGMGRGGRDCCFKEIGFQIVEEEDRERMRGSDDGKVIAGRKM